MSLVNESVLTKLLQNLKTVFNSKQDSLTAGANITISGGVISATDTNTTYTAGTNISISNNNVISSSTPAMTQQEILTICSLGGNN